MDEEFPIERRFPRIPSHHAVLVKRLDPVRPTEELALTEVVGLGGFMFLSEESLGVGSLLEVLISLEGRVLKTVSRVVYEHPGPEGKLEVGVEFLEIPEADREALSVILERGSGS